MSASNALARDARAAAELAISRIGRGGTLEEAAKAVQVFAELVRTRSELGASREHAESLDLLSRGLQQAIVGPAALAVVATPVVAPPPVTRAAPLPPLAFTAAQSQLIRDSFANGATEEEFAVLMEVAKARNLNPLLRQIHFVKRWDTTKRREVWSSQTSIDGLRLIADRTGLYDGQDEAEFQYSNEGKLQLARVRIFRKDWSRPAVGVAHWREYVQLTKEGAPNSMWAKFSHVMLAKCAEALALRKAFPEETSGLYVPEEMSQSPEAEDRPSAAPGKAASPPRQGKPAAPSPQQSRTEKAPPRQREPGDDVEDAEVVEKLTEEQQVELAEKWMGEIERAETLEAAKAAGNAHHEERARVGAAQWARVKAFGRERIAALGGPSLSSKK